MTTPHPLLWQETKDANGNSRFEAISMTYGDGAGTPSFLWVIVPVLRNNSVAWSVQETARELAPDEGFPEPFSDYEHGNSIEEAKAWCQTHEDELRAILGDGLLPYAEPEPETPPLTGDEHGFAPTLIVRPRWSRNEGVLRMYRVWKNPETGHEQEREILDQPDLDRALGGYFTQIMVEELVTRLSTGGFGRLIKDTPFATVVMTAELDFLDVSSFTARIHGKNARDIAIPLPSHERIMQVVARQMQERQRELAEKVGNVSTASLVASIQRNARLLGLPCDLTLADAAPDESKILPITIEDVQAGGGDITDLGQKRGGKR